MLKLPITQVVRQKSRETRVSEDLPFFTYLLRGVNNIIGTDIVNFLGSSRRSEKCERITILHISYRNTPNKGPGRLSIFSIF